MNPTYSIAAKTASEEEIEASRPKNLYSEGVKNVTDEIEGTPWGILRTRLLNECIDENYLELRELNGELNKTKKPQKLTS